MSPQAMPALTNLKIVFGMKQMVMFTAKRMTFQGNTPDGVEGR